MYTDADFSGDAVTCRCDAPFVGNKLNDNQVWQITAYVRSLSGQVSKDVAPSRSDDMSGPPPESSTERKPPVKSGGIPKSAEMPK